MADPQYAEDLLDSRAAPQEYAEDVLARHDISQARDWSGTDAEGAYFLGKLPGQILDLFGQGFKEGWGTKPLGQLDPGIEKELKDYGVINDYTKGSTSVLKQFNESLLRSTALGMDFFMRTPYAMARGYANVPGLNIIGGPLSAMFEGGIGEIPHTPPMAEGMRAGRDILGRADDMGLLNERAETQRKAREALAPTGEERANERVVLPETPVEEAPVPVTQDVPAAATTVNELARQIAPEAFEKWDALKAQKDTFNQWLDEIRQKTVAPIQAEIDTILSKVKGDEDRLTNAAALRLELRRRELAEALTTETPELATVRKELLNTDIQMRDMAPEISEHYRQARDTLPAAEPIPAEPIPANTVMDTAPRTAEPPVATLADLGLEPQQIQNLSQRQRSIAADVASKLIAAGRDVEEARSAAAMIQAHYQSRAARFGGALGTPRQIYDREAPNIVGGEGTTRGRTTIGPERNTISLFKNADASTFLHETAHDWFEELLRDSKHEAAPPGLVDDVGAVKDWLGMQGERPSRAQHEKFARGFERYMMEGVAPSPKLAGVFAKFKDWLAKIYQTVSALRAPINDEIRGVFDRLLSTDADRTVTAPDVELVRNFAEQHETEVAALRKTAATPEDVIALADRMRAERDMVAATIRGELALGRERARARRSGTNAERTGVAPGSDAGAKPNELRTGNAEANAEERPSGAGSTPVESPARSDESFPRQPNDFVNADGTFKIDAIERPEDIDAAISESGPTRSTGPSDGEILRLSDAIGVDPMFLDRGAIGQHYNAGQIRAITEMAKQASTKVWEWMRAVDAGKGDPLELAKAVTRLEMIQGKAQAIASDWGRAGLALQELKRFTGDPETLNLLLKEQTGRSYDQLLWMAKLGKYLMNQGQISKFIANTSGGKVRNGIVFYWVNSLVSGPISHAAYIAGNAVNALADPLLYRPGAALIDSLSGNTKDRVHWQEVGASFYGLAKGSWDGFPAAYAAFKTGQTGLSSGSGFTFVNPIGGPIGNAIAIPYKSVSAIHQFFLTMRYEQEVQALAVREAMDQGLTGQARGSLVAQLTQSPTQAIMDAAEKHAYTEMYMRTGNYNNIVSGVTRELHKTMVGQIVFPFIKIGAEITRQTWVKHTPVGLAWEEVRGDLAGRKGGPAQSTALAKQGVGLALLGSGAFLASQGIINGFGPSDPDRRREWLGDHQPYSINIGNLQVPMKGLGPLGNIMMFGADTWETGHYMTEEDSMSKWAAGYIKAIARGTLDESFFRDLSNLHEVINDPAQHADRWLGDMAANWLPFSIGMGQVNRYFIDPYSKDVHDLFDAVRARIPGASYGVPNRIDYFGNPIPSRGIGTVYSRYKDDPVQQTMNRLNVAVGRLDRHIDHVELTGHQYEQYGILAGQMTHRLLSEVVTSPGFATLPQGMQVREIHRLIGAARNIARVQIKMDSYGKDNDVITKALDNKMKLLK